MGDGSKASVASATATQMAAKRDKRRGMGQQGQFCTCCVSLLFAITLLISVHWLLFSWHLFKLMPPFSQFSFNGLHEFR